MFVPDSIFKAVTPNTPPLVLVDYFAIGQAVLPEGESAHVISEDGGDITLNIYLS